MTELYVRSRSWLGERLRKDDGATAVEYALMLALIAIVIFAAVQFVGLSANSKFEDPTLISGLS